jgi:flavodoxin
LAEFREAEECVRHVRLRGGGENSVMDTVVIAYSLGGKTERIAQEIAGALGADFCRIECRKYADVEIDEMRAGLLLNVIPMAFSSLFGGRPEIDVECDLGAYDFIVLGFPIWAGKPATPINSLLHEADFKEKKCALFATVEGGGSADNAFSSLSGAISLQGGAVVEAASFEVKGTRQEKYLEQAREFAGRLKSRIGS